jgi:putative hydrolase of the HAD superfamily
MAEQNKITTFFLDIGGVLLTNGWDRHARNLAVKTFNLDEEEINERHHLTFDTYEAGKLSLDDYTDRVVFYEKRNFSKSDFKSFMFEQSKPFPEMLELIKGLKEKFNLKITAVSNEGRELTEHRIHTYKLDKIFDTFIASSFVHFRKPDVDIYKMALDASQVTPDKVLYIDDRHMFIEVAGTLGINGIHHIKYETTKNELANYGFILKEKQ